MSETSTGIGVTTRVFSRHDVIRGHNTIAEAASGRTKAVVDWTLSKPKGTYVY